MDLDVLKEIPGYKAILKSVIRSQIQLLIEQLSEHAGEEAVILTASLHDGTLSHLGSNTGKGFLEGRDEIKSQFLGYCLKSHHKKKTSEVRSSPYQRPSVQPASHRRARSQNVSTLQEGSNLDLFTPPEIHRAPSHPNGQNDTRVNIKLESSEQGTSRNQGSGYVADSATFPSSLQLSHTQTSSEHDSDDKNELQNNSNPENDNENDENTATSIKIEPITENEMELEITGVEPGKLSGDPESWGQGHSISANSDTAGGSDGDQSTYKALTQAYHSVQVMHYPQTSSGKPLIFLQPVKLQDATVALPIDSKNTPTQDVASQSSFTKMPTTFECAPKTQINTASSTFRLNTLAPKTQINAASSTFRPNTLAPKTQINTASSTFRPNTLVTPIPLSGNQKIVIPANPDDQTLPLTKENYGKEKNRWVLKKHICQYCGKRCMKPSELIRHVKTHTGEKNYECSDCGKKYREKYELNVHICKAQRKGQS